MRRNLAVAGGIVAGITAIAVVATPAFAQGGPPAAAGTATHSPVGTPPAWAGSGTGTGYADRSGMGRGMGGGMGGGMGRGMGGGMDADLTNVASGTLTSAQKTSLANVAQDEKLAHDLYVALAAKYPGTVQFARIAQAESRHLAEVQILLKRYSLADPTAGTSAGQFTSPAVQKLYDTLLAGATTSAAALAAGVTVEKTDIADITTAMSGLTAPDALLVYTHLRNASQRHLSAFGG